MQAYETENGRREDLEAPLLELNPYLGMIGQEVLPFSDRRTKAGTYYYQILQADAAAQTGRDSVTAPTRVTITEHSSTWSAAERIKGYQCPRDSVKTQFGSIEAADMFGAKAALRSVARSHEAAVAAATLANGTATVADILDSFIEAAQTGLKTIKRYPGKKALVLSQTVFNRIMRYTEITGRFGLASANIQGVGAEQIVAREPEALKLLLRAIIGLDEILIGDDDIWYDGSVVYQDRAVLVALPRNDMNSELEEAQFGKTLRYLPDGQSYPYYIESYFDRDNKVNKWDSSVWDSLEIFNTGALYILDGIDEGNVVTTTTTTTTAA